MELEKVLAVAGVEISGKSFEMEENTLAEDDQQEFGVCKVFENVDIYRLRIMVIQMKPFFKVEINFKQAETTFSPVYCRFYVC